jgi:protein subunit release factor A
VELRAEDLRIESFRHAIPGAKSVLLRVTHLPTGIAVERPTTLGSAFEEIRRRLDAEWKERDEETRR